MEENNNIDVNYVIIRNGNPKKIVISFGEAIPQKDELVISIAKDVDLNKKTAEMLFEEIYYTVEAMGFLMQSFPIEIINNDINAGLVKEILDDAHFNSKLVDKQELKKDKNEEEMNQELADEFGIKYANGKLPIKETTYGPAKVLDIDLVQLYGMYMYVVTNDKEFGKKMGESSKEEKAELLFEKITGMSSAYKASIGKEELGKTGVGIDDKSGRQYIIDSNGERKYLDESNENISANASLNNSEYNSLKEFEQDELNGKFYDEQGNEYSNVDSIEDVNNPGKFVVVQNGVIIGNLKNKEKRNVLTRTKKPNNQSRYGFVNMGTLIIIVMGILMLSLVAYGYVLINLR